MSDGRPAPTRVAEQRTSGADTTTVVSAQDVAWLLTRLQAAVAASPVAWAGRGMTLGQLIALHFIGAQAPMALTDLSQVLGTAAPATSAMVNRLTRIGLVSSTPDPQNRRRIRLTLTARAKPIVGDIDLDTAQRLQTVLNGMSPQAHRHLIDVLRDTVRRAAGQPRKRRSHP